MGLEDQERLPLPKNLSPHEMFVTSLNGLMYYAEGNIRKWNASLLEAALKRIEEVEGLGLALGMQPRVLYSILRYGTSKIVVFAGGGSDGGQREVLENKLTRFIGFLGVNSPFPS